MAEASGVAFGRYLRQLRERRALSMGRVCDLTKNTPEPLDKATLSRLERGQQATSIYRLGPISRIYEIAADALLERMELDRELDRLEGPDTSGRSYDVLRLAGVDAVTRKNRKWDAYAFFRDAVPAAPADKRVAAWINLASSIRSLGKNALALHELRALLDSKTLDAGQRAIVHERLSNCCRCLGDLKRAESYADAAIAEARALGDARTVAYALSARAAAAVDQEQWDAGYDLITASLAAYREGIDRESRLQPSPSFEAVAFLMLAECSLQLANRSRARRLILVARRLSERHDLPLGLAYSELLTGWIDEAEGRVEQALLRWRRAIALAARIDYPRIAFTAEVEIYRIALGAGRAARARACRRRLERLVPWIPRHIPAYNRYRQLIEQEGETHGEFPKVSAVGARHTGDAVAVPRRNDRRPVGATGVSRRVASDVR